MPRTTIGRRRPQRVLQPIAEIAHHRIDEDVGDAAEAEDHARHGEAETNPLRGIELRQMHDDRQAQRR